MRTKRLIFGVGMSAAALLSVSSVTAHASTATSTPLKVTLGASSDGASAVWNASGDPVFTLGSDSGTTYAQMLVSGTSAEPANAPSFTTNNYAAGSPRWALELSDGYYLFGYPEQLGGGATADFTGPQWNVNGPSTTACGGSYVTYSKALSCADPDGASTVTHAYIVADGDQAPGVSDTLTNIQYNGQTLSPGTVIVTSPGRQSTVSGTAVDLAIKAATSTSDQALAYSATGLPTGLAINVSTGVVSGTPTAAGSFNATVTATDAYGDNASQSFTWTVTAAPVYTGSAGPGVIRNAGSGKCLNVASGNYSDTGTLNQYTCNAPWHGEKGGAQQFEIVTENGSIYLKAISPDGTHPTLYVTSGLKSHPLTLSTTPSADAVMHKTGSYYTFPATGLVMDVKGASTANLAPVIGYPNHGGINQQWSMP